MDSLDGKLLMLLAITFLVGCVTSQDYDYPTYSEDYLPETSFTCSGKVHGGYYADIETGCQMYHICARDKHGFMISTKFLCGNGTVFDQRHLICQDYRKVQHCKDSEKYYRNTAASLRILGEKLKSEKRDQEILRAEHFYSDYYPMYSEDNLPRTSFTCNDKIHGGYYADIETDCQMYHVCSKDKYGFMRSTRFLCGNGTAFDQRHLVCENYRNVYYCQDSPKYYKNAARNRQLLEGRLRPRERHHQMFKTVQLHRQPV